jgi:transcriptional regulator of met regulon
VPAQQNADAEKKKRSERVKELTVSEVLHNLVSLLLTHTTMRSKTRKSEAEKNFRIRGSLTINSQ